MRLHRARYATKMAIFSTASKITRPQRPSGINRLTKPTTLVGMTENSRMATTPPIKAAQAISAF